MITKEQMEEAWRTGRVGWLKDTNKLIKGRQQYTLVARPYIKNYLDPVEVTVYAKSIKDAMTQSYKASEKVREKYPDIKDIGWVTGIKS